MATFDQLPAEQRAIIELVVARGRTYDALADVLQVPASRVRELARDALVELSPVTGGRVDPQWRGQVADYLLGQQSSAESTATRAHLKRSEAARSWALSVLDALDTLYANGDRPELPEVAVGAGGGADGDAAVVEEPQSEGARTEKRERVRARKAGRKPAAAAEAAKPKAAAKTEEKPKTPVAGRSVLSPAAQSALRRRRLIGAAIGIGALAAVALVLLLTGVFGGDDEEGGGGGSDEATQTETTTTPAGGAGGGEGEPELVGQIPLRAIGGARAQGNAYILQQGEERVLGVQAQLPALPSSQRKAAYNVWLYNSPKDAESIGAQFTTPKGEYQGVGQLPENYERFKFIDVSRQPFNNRPNHSGQSVLRGRLADLQQPPQQGQAQP